MAPLLNGINNGERHLSLLGSRFKWESVCSARALHPAAGAKEGVHLFA